MTIGLKLLILFTRLTYFAIEIIAQYSRMKNSNKVDGKNKYDVTLYFMTSFLGKNDVTKNIVYTDMTNFEKENPSAIS